MKERKLYSLTGKLIVFLLLIVFAASALFGGIQTLMLSSVGLTPNAAAKKYAFEETTACGTLVQRQLHNVMSYYNDMSKFGTNGRYDGTKEIDYRAFATDGEGSGGISTTYTIDQLVKMYDDGSSADLNEVAAYTADNYATNDAGIDKEAYLAYEDGTDVSQETEETDVAALTEEVSAADAETFDSFSPDGEVYFPSDNAVKSLKEPNLVVIFIGIVLGLALGAIPFSIPGVSTPVKLGLAGGPIIVGILLGTFGPRIHMITYTTRSANLMLRALGLSMYLACLGLDAGAHFFDTVFRPEGLLWIALGAGLTIVPTVLVGFIAFKMMKIDFGTVSGMLCGSMANPMALNYVNDTIPGDNPSVAYATVYPLCMFLRVIIAQVLLMFLLN